MRSLIAQLVALGPELALFILSSPLFYARVVHAAPQSVPSPNLDLSQLGRVALAGDFDSISVYEYVGQSQDATTTNDSQALLTRYPNGGFETLGTADAYIETMCPFVSNGVLQGVVIGGNFTSLGGVEAQGVALYNPNTTDITALPGLSGQVAALYCDDTSGTVYVGGSFSAGNSTNAMAWTTGWTNLPFEGFNGPVTSITKNAAGNIIFGGNFEGLGNTTTPKDPDLQVINLGAGNITSSGTSSTAGFDDPSQIICKTGAQDGAGNTWLLADSTAGYWQGSYSFGFNPTKIRLYNTQYEGRGTRTFYYEDLNSGGILNLNYIDENGDSQSCSARCPLAQNSTSQDFHFVPPVGMNMFRVQIVEWYGKGGGLAGIELFQDDIYSFAVNDFNEPKCDDISTGSTSTLSPSSGTWTRTPNNGDTSSDYVTAVLNSSSQIGSGTSVTFSPNLAQSGNYSIMVYTPGCIQDNSCDQRGQVSMTGTTTSNEPAFSTVLYQTNYYDKFDQVYYGYVDAGSFRPTVTLAPVAGQNAPLTVVAQRVRFELVKSTGGLNGLYEFNPNQAVTDTDFTTSAIDVAGHGLAGNAVINAVVAYNQEVFVAGNFSGDGIANVMSVGSNATALPGGGLNAQVHSVYQNGSILYMGGNFTNTQDNSVQGLNSLAAYNAETRDWSALGDGVNGPVFSLVPLDINITDGDLQSCITVNGVFDSVNGFGDNETYNTSGFAVWVPSRNNWLHNLPDATVALNGKLITSTKVPGSEALLAGQISAQPLGLSDAVQLVGSGRPGLQALGLKIQSSSSSSPTQRKRALNDTGSSDASGVYTGLYFGDDNFNITVLGGNFVAQASNGSDVSNLVFINNTVSTESITGVSGLESTSTIVAMDTVNTLLVAGGSVSGMVNGKNVNGLVVLDLATGQYTSPQPPALAGGDAVVGAIATQPKTSIVYVGGNFQSAGSLPCQTLCHYDTSVQQWNTPGSGISGTINAMTWTSNTDLVIAGNLTLGGNTTTMATYDSKTEAFTTFDAASTLPGPIISLSAASSDYKSWWAAGVSTKDNTAYLAKYSNNAWTTVPGLGAGTLIRGLQVLAVTQSHVNTDLVSSDEVLMLSGTINISDFGNASAALYNGTAFTPFLLTSKSSGTSGSLSGMFVSKPQGFLANAGGHLALGLVVLVGLGIALFLIFALVVAGILLERRRRRAEGYVPMSLDRGPTNVNRIPPSELFERLGEKDAAPKI